MATDNPMLEILKNMPPQTIALLVFVLVLGILSQTLSRRRNKPPTHKPLPKPKPEQTAEPLTREEQKGQRGENLIADILYDTVTGEFALFQNVYVPNEGKTSEIDLVMVHEKGVFVFESKNYGGWIYGSIEDLNWTQMFPDRKSLFYNPVRQNQNHIKALSQYLQMPERCFYSYIVFSDRCLLRKVPDNTSSMIITQSVELDEHLKRMISALPPLYSAEEVRRIADRLVPLTDVSEEVKAQHIADIRAAQESTICPFCGNELVMRHGKYGDFWGCSSYPKCKFKRKVEE